MLLGQPFTLGLGGWPKRILVGERRDGVSKPVPSISSSPLKHLSVSDTAKLDELFDHTGLLAQF